MFRTRRMPNGTINGIVNHKSQIIDSRLRETDLLTKSEKQERLKFIIIKAYCRHYTYVNMAAKLCTVKGHLFRAGLTKSDHLFTT